MTLYKVIYNNKMSNPEIKGLDDFESEEKSSKVALKHTYIGIPENYNNYYYNEYCNVIYFCVQFLSRFVSYSHFERKMNFKDLYLEIFKKAWEMNYIEFLELHKKYESDKLNMSFEDELLLLIKVMIRFFYKDVDYTITSYYKDYDTSIWYYGKDSYGYHRFMVKENAKLTNNWSVSFDYILDRKYPLNPTFRVLFNVTNLPGLEFEVLANIIPISTTNINLGILLKKKTWYTERIDCHMKLY